MIRRYDKLCECHGFFGTNKIIIGIPVAQNFSIRNSLCTEVFNIKCTSKEQRRSGKWGILWIIQQKAFSNNAKVENDLINSRLGT